MQKIKFMHLKQTLFHCLPPPRRWHCQRPLGGHRRSCRRGGRHWSRHSSSPHSDWAPWCRGRRRMALKNTKQKILVMIKTKIETKGSNYFQFHFTTTKTCPGSVQPSDHVIRSSLTENWKAQAPKLGSDKNRKRRTRALKLSSRQIESREKKRALCIAEHCRSEQANSLICQTGKEQTSKCQLPFKSRRDWAGKARVIQFKSLSYSFDGLRDWKDVAAPSVDVIDRQH